MRRFTIYFCKTLYMFQTVFPSIIRSSKLHIQRQVFVRPLLLPAAGLVRLTAGNSNGLYVQFWAPDDGRKNPLKHLERLTEINKLRNVASCWLYSANILAMHGPVNVWLAVCSSFPTLNFSVLIICDAISLRFFPPQTPKGFPLCYNNY